MGGAVAFGVLVVGTGSFSPASAPSPVGLAPVLDASWLLASCTLEPTDVVSIRYRCGGGSKAPRNSGLPYASSPIQSCSEGVLAGLPGGMSWTLLLALVSAAWPALGVDVIELCCIPWIVAVGWSKPSDLVVL